MNSILELKITKVIRIKNIKFKNLKIYIFALKKIIFLASIFIFFIKKYKNKRYKYRFALKLQRPIFLKKKKLKFFFIELKKTQLFFIFLNKLLKVFKTFSCGVIFKLLRISKKCAKKKKINFIFLNTFLKKYFNVFLLKNTVLVIKAFLFKYTAFILKFLEFISLKKTSVIFVSKISLNIYKFRRVKAIKKVLKKRLK